MEPVSHCAHLAPPDWSQGALSYFRIFTQNQAGMSMKVSAGGVVTVLHQPLLLQVESTDQSTGVSSVHLYYHNGTSGSSSVADELITRGQAKRAAPPTIAGERE